jgi:hypothetical protein
VAIDRTYAPGWGFAGQLTSAQLNGIDVSSTYELDKQHGAGDVLGSVVQATGAGRIVSTVQTGPDADITFYASGHNRIVRVPTLTARRIYTLGTSGATGGDRIAFYIEGTACSPSGYARIANISGTGIFRLGLSAGYQATGAPNASWLSEGDACEAIFVATGWQLANGAGPGLRGREFTSTLPSEWTCPPGIFSINLEGWGGGGGGAGGDRGLAMAGVTGAVGYVLGGGGGGGGGGAWRSQVQVPVVPGRVYEGLAGGVGAGGLRGQWSGPVRDACPGGVGGDSIFREKVTGNVLATFRGAEGGTPPRTSSMAVIGINSVGLAPPTGGLNYVPTALPMDFGWGGRPMRPITTGVGTFGVTMMVPSSVYAGLGNLLPPGAGGIGATVWSSAIISSAQNGRANHGGFAGGQVGTGGGQISLFAGGAGGGGGGGGPGGVGANGGAGGFHGGSSGTSGAIGAAASANSGAGGGGGGGAGDNGTNYSGGYGGPGGTGKIILTF